MLENLRQNKLLIEKGKKFKIYYFLIETNHNIESDINIGDISFLYNLDHVNYDGGDDNRQLISDIKKIQQADEFLDTNNKVYLLAVKIVSLTQKEVEHPVTKLSQVIDPEIGIGVSPSEICKDLLNILTLYSEAWFKIEKQLSLEDENEEFSLIKQEFKKISYNKQGKDLTHNLETFCSLREDQFYLIQKSLSRLNQSLQSVDEDIELGLVLLVSTIENLSRKYGEVDESFNDDLEFYSKLKTIIENPKYSNILGEEVSKDLFQEIGETYINLSHLRTTAKYKNFCLIYTSPSIVNEKYEEMIKNIYRIRSLILHAGKELVVSSKNQVIMYNLQTPGGNVKSFQDKKGMHADLVRIPCYNDLLKIFSNILRNFIAYLFSVKDSEDDMKLYKKGDRIKRNMLVGSINKNGYKPGYVVNLESDFNKKMDFIEITRVKHKIIEIEDLIKKYKNEEALTKVDLIFTHQDFSMEYYFFRCACYLKIKLLHDSGDFEGSLKVFEDYHIEEINDENLLYFNLKAYCKAKLDNFEEAHEVIDIIIGMAKEDELKACFFDSKGDFYKLAGDYQNAIIFYNKSLEYKKDPPYGFHEETKAKLTECQKRLED
ncbi:MAG: tetratricopeptide repeat protein [Candidatus Helarchaeota archaeon]